MLREFFAIVRIIVFQLLNVVNFILLVVPWWIILAIQKKPQKFYQVGIFHFSRVLPWLGLKVEVRGKENIPKDQSFLVMSNHQSFLDIPLIMVHVRLVAFLAKKELFKVPFFGSAMAFGGTLKVDRGNRQANKSLPLKLRNHIERGFSYCVFPEGTRSRDGKILSFKTGIFRIVKEEPIPVLPVSIDGANRAMPRKRFRFYPEKVVITIHQAVMPEEIKNLDVHDFRNLVRERVASSFPEEMR